jgi:hypothetical protein
MASIRDCAELSQDVYDRTGNTQASAVGWSRRDPINWGQGFAAGTYDKRGETVIAFRGTETDDGDDLISDAMMVPLTHPGDAMVTLQTLLRHYNVSNTGVIANIAPQLLENLFQSPAAKIGVYALANTAPREQLQKALAYFDRAKPRPAFVTGHSLGGALAQLVSQQRDVPCVAFNSPHMGDLQGVVPMTSMLIVQVNANGDPLSLATRAAGNLTHGRVITVNIPPFHAPPQYEPQNLPRWATLVAPVTTMVFRALSAEIRYSKALLAYLGEVMLYYHSMENLCNAVKQNGNFSVALQPDMRNVRE